MSPHRQLAKARADVIDAARAFATEWSRCAIADNDEFDTLVGALHAYDDLAADTHTDGAASPRDTSIAASKNLSVMSSWRGQVQRQAFEFGKVQPGLFGQAGGFTCDEMEVALRGSHQSVSSAVNWCEHAGWIIDSGHRRPTRSGASAIVYEPTDHLVNKIREWRWLG